MLQGFPVIALAAAASLVACAGSRERAQEPPSQEPVIQETTIPSSAESAATEEEGGSTEGISRSDVPADPRASATNDSMEGEAVEETKETEHTEGTMPTDIPSEREKSQEKKRNQEKAVEETRIPGSGHGSGVPGYDPTEDPALREEPAVESPDDTISTTKVPKKGAPERSDSGQEFYVEPESGVLQPESGSEVENREPAETVIPKKDGNAPYTEKTQPHTDFGRKVKEKEIIPDATTEESGLPEGVEQTD